MLRSGRDLCDFITRFDVPFVEHPEIEAGSSVLDQQRGHIRLVHADADPVTGDARLRHLEQGTPDPVTISDAHLRI